MYRAKHTFWHDDIEYVQGSLHKEVPSEIIGDFEVVEIKQTNKKQVKKALNKKVKKATTK